MGERTKWSGVTVTVDGETKTFPSLLRADPYYEKVIANKPRSKVSLRVDKVVYRANHIQKDDKI